MFPPLESELVTDVEVTLLRHTSEEASASFSQDICIADTATMLGGSQIDRPHVGVPTTAPAKVPADSWQQL